jgi:hypothetical protein
MNSPTSEEDPPFSRNFEELAPGCISTPDLAIKYFLETLGAINKKIDRKNCATGLKI